MLPPETERVWRFLATQPSLAGFVLIGGTALALRLKHRRSEDLDLVYLEARLPRLHLQALLRIFTAQRDQFETNAAAEALRLRQEKPSG